MPYSGNPTVANFKTDMKNLTAQMQGSLEENFGRQADELMENMRPSNDLWRTMSRRTLSR